MTLILASASRARADILRRAGLDIAVHPAGIDEAAVKSAHGQDAEALPALLASAKAQAVAKLFPDALVIGCDQVLLFDGRVVDKSDGIAQARALLKQLRGRSHDLLSACALVKQDAVIWQGRDRARLRMRDVSDGFIDAYLAAEAPAILSCVGCYRLEGLGAQLFDAIEGDYFTVLGLPLLPLLAALREVKVLQS